MLQLLELAILGVHSAKGWPSTAKAAGSSGNLLQSAPHRLAWRQPARRAPALPLDPPTGLPVSEIACSSLPCGASRLHPPPGRTASVLASPGKAQLIVRPVLTRLLGALALAARCAAHVVLLSETPRVHRPQLGQPLLDRSELPLDLFGIN